MKLFSLVLLLLVLSISPSFSFSQVFIPFSNWQDLTPCKAGYCPTPSPIAATLLGIGGMTQIVNIGTCAASGAGDDEFIQVTLPFNFAISSLGYRNWFIGSNTFITAESGSGAYTGLNGATPPLRKFHLGSADNSYRQVYSLSGTNFFRVRYQGFASTNCTGTQIVYEFTFFRPAGMTTQYAVVVFGTHGRAAGQFGVASPSAYLLNNTGALSANQSYLYTSNNGGTTWTSQAGWSLVGVGTNL